MSTKTKFHPVVEELKLLIEANGWESLFVEALADVHKHKVPILDKIKTVEDYLNWINEFLHWVPFENERADNVYINLCAFYFILDQKPLMALQNDIKPHDEAQELTIFSNWIVQYANAMGQFMDTPESLTASSLETFKRSPNYNLKEYIEPHGGWKTFNQFFARNFKPGYRPVAAISDQTVIVSPADCTFSGQWEIRPDSHVTVKNLHWKISELMEGSPFKDRFENGLFMHAFLSPTDYHRQHAPVGGKVVEARVIPGQAYLEVNAIPVQNALGQYENWKKTRLFDAPDNAGYQFAQARGLIVLDTPIGLVAILPIGMCQISSVYITAEEGVTLRKGEEISYFQFGGSDIIVLFESAANVSFVAQPGVHHKMGTRLAQAYPVI